MPWRPQDVQRGEDHVQFLAESSAIESEGRVAAAEQRAAAAEATAARAEQTSYAAAERVRERDATIEALQAERAELVRGMEGERRIWSEAASREVAAQRSALDDARESELGRARSLIEQLRLDLDAARLVTAATRLGTRSSLLAYCCCPFCCRHCRCCCCRRFCCCCRRFCCCCRRCRCHCPEADAGSRHVRACAQASAEHVAVKAQLVAEAELRAAADEQIVSLQQQAVMASAEAAELRSRLEDLHDHAEHAEARRERLGHVAEGGRLDREEMLDEVEAARVTAKVGLQPGPPPPACRLPFSFAFPSTCVL